MNAMLPRHFPVFVRLGILGLLAVTGLVAFPSQAETSPPQSPLEQLAAFRRGALVQAGFERLELGAGADRLVYFAAGKGQPLIFLHGVGDQAGAWAEVAPSFADRYRVFLPDLPGHGESEPVQGDLAMAQVVAGAERILISATSEGQPAIVVGNSMGAWLATLLAHRHPDQVARIVLVNGGALVGDPTAPSLQPKTREEAAKLMAMLRDPSAPTLPDAILDDIVRRAADGPTARLLRDLPGLIAHLLEGRLGEVKTPVDLLWGASDQLMKPAYAERQQNALPRVRLTLIEKCGHVPQVECPQRFREALAALLAGELPAPSATPAKAGASR
jgi:3-oxoadipate enol-lactonase